MKLKTCITLSVALFSGIVYGTDGIEWTKDFPLFDSISATSTKLLVKLSSVGSSWLIRVPEKGERWLKSHEELVLVPNQEIWLSEWHGRIIFTPAFFKSQQTGFRIASTFHWGDGVTTNALVYVALGDTLTEMKEADVKMVMEWELDPFGNLHAGEWKEYEKPQPVITDEGGGATASHPAKNENNDGIPAVESDGGLQPPEQADTIPPTTGSRHHVWFYAVIPLGLLAVLYFMRRKSKN